MELSVQTHTAAQTEQLAERIGRQLRGGEVIELVSDLGGGKTTFVRGLVRGFGSADRVASPTFTISKLYQAGDRQIVHFDFYRLSEPGLMVHELAEYLDDPHSVVVVEWGDLVQSVLPANRLTIRLARQGETERQITMHYPAKASKWHKLLDAAL